ncbi:hypothetical protein G6O67_005117 [Ophiocordyceps sinensis]|uniref:DUF3669 domain-containing protein n=2 Tax=Ophiocordyceps sinensis TaxID=72228 RepID=A0A8H4PQY7_9HYPO|nr:hypothetical protein OCS_06008 [Ophiocordyceps sinensis CO18]KAF4508778.1 hypothetical protein G6O67_005117 [Ophiocordyceps sinensis]
MASVHAALLRRVFSTDPDTPSADVEHDMVRPPPRPPMCNIGRGTCGTVYDMGSTNRAIKLGSSAKDLLRDYQQTATARRAVNEWAAALVTHFEAKGLRISVPKMPRCYEFHTDCAEVVKRHEEELASDDVCSSSDSDISEIERTKPGFIMERIPAIPHCAREALVKEFFDEEDHDYFLHDMDSLDCLVRLYFGQEDNGAAISDLRNFPLYTDQMDDIGLDTKTLVTELAVGLAIVHWGAELDAMDSEYVLASSSPYLSRSRTSNLDLTVGDAAEPTPDITRRDTCIWILDFDKASFLDLDDHDETVRRLVVATSGNDPYFPRVDLNEERWLQFREAYVEASEVILTARAARGEIERGLSRLPEQFMGALYQHYMDDADQGDYIVFSD